MSDWIGAGVYQIASARNPKAFANLNDAGRSGKADGTKMNMWSNHNDNHWHFIYAGIGSTGKEEYLIVNRASGTNLTWPAGLASSSQPVGYTWSPSATGSRWSVIPCCNGTGRYWIAPVGNKNMSLNCRGGSTTNGTDVIMYAGAGTNPTDLSSQWYLRLVRGVGVLSCPEVPAAPTTTDSKL